MLALNDLIQLVDVQTYLGEEVLNIFYYRCSVLAAPADTGLEEFIAAFEGGVLIDITAIQCDTLLHTQRVAKNLTNGIDFFIETSVVPGQISSTLDTSEPSFVSAGYVLQRTNLNTRNGYKRFAGMNSTNIGGNTWVGSFTPRDNVADSLAQSLTTLSNDEFIPVIVKRPIPAPGGAEAITNPVQSASFRLIGTQNTRKPGRGV